MFLNCVERHVTKLIQMATDNFRVLEFNDLLIFGTERL